MVAPTRKTQRDMLVNQNIHAHYNLSNKYTIESKKETSLLNSILWDDNTRYTPFILETLMGRKPNKNFLNIGSQYNAKTINQNNREYTTLSNAPLSSFFSQLQLPNLRIG
jgi:hypothetical protein